MDNVETLPSVQRSESVRGDFRGGSESGHYRLAAADLHELRFDSLIKIGEICARYNQLGVPTEETTLFVQQLTTDRDAWFIEAGDIGLIYLTSIQPRRDAIFHCVFWDNSLAMDRLAACKSVIADAFRRFALPRMSSAIAQPNLPLKRFIQDCGFVLEGVTRLGWSIDPPIDTIHYGMLASEVPFPVLPIGGE